MQTIRRSHERSTLFSQNFEKCVILYSLYYEYEKKNKKIKKRETNINTVKSTAVLSFHSESETAIKHNFVLRRPLVSRVA